MTNAENAAKTWLVVKRFSGYQSVALTTVEAALASWGTASVWYIADHETGDMVWQNPDFPYGM